jgi:SAM-dependent methyltransferase
MTKTTKYEYKDTFYKYINTGAIRSANVILPLVHRYFRVTSVADFGCGQGAWLSVWKSLGVKDVVGLDGDYVARNGLLISVSEFQVGDLTRPVRLNRKFDLVQSLEVAEHLPEAAAETFIESIVSHGNVVLFSAAAPGQGGENHINEKSYDYWRKLFRNRNYIMLDLIRPNVMGRTIVDSWYRYNTFVFVHKSLFDSLLPEVAKYCIDDSEVVPDISPWIYKLRKLLVRSLPCRVITRLAVLKKTDLRGMLSRYSVI